MSTDTRMTSIIIPTYNGLPLLATCVGAIRQYTDTPYEIIVVDNASTDGTDHYCIKEGIPFISLPENRGFPIACNMGLAAAGGDDLLLLNNDVTVTANWLTNMLAALHSREDVGLVGPVTNAASGRQKVEVAFQNIEEFQQVAARNNQSDPSRWVEVNRIIGMCLLMKRDVLSRIGFLDEAFSPGHYEDDDYCYRARLAGYRLLVCGDALVYHQGSASFMRSASDQIQQLIDRNHRLFMDKWHIDPRQFIEKAGSISEGGGVQ
ncbi:glycosyltransferase family 2 protein [Paenibacillus cellulositrophicus]|uniref:glycosyltransferase family 2 protein n=1 Tax=Paenibacillus TaxID=44249 RepID=UPI000E28323D|nr:MULTISPECIES: glycosyltransferase family 2 protein [Paenibacillus]MCM3001861.1 glycosyltransferase family 2 protein [Paenibacillus cellulositrophicus]RED31619.1 GT2 family glycosyltransferase [Paenibacillus sp. VMFN-D1]